MTVQLRFVEIGPSTSRRPSKGSCDCTTLGSFGFEWRNSSNEKRERENEDANPHTEKGTGKEGRAGR